jgi:hypothetical protein
MSVHICEPQSAAAQALTGYRQQQHSDAGFIVKKVALLGPKSLIIYRSE